MGALSVQKTFYVITIKYQRIIFIHFLLVVIKLKLFKSDFSFHRLWYSILHLIFFLFQEQRDHGNLITRESFSAYTVDVLKNSKFDRDTIIYICQYS